jgi:hypothetical protein
MRRSDSRTPLLLVAAAALLLAACGLEPEAGELAMDEDTAEQAEDTDLAATLLEGEEIGEIDAALSSNLIANPGFESSWTGWSRVSPTGLSTVARSGSSSAKLSGTTGQIKRTIGGLSSGTSYTLSAWVRGSARIGARNFGGTAVSASKSASDWTQVTVSFKTGSSSKSVEIYASWVSGGEARVDDFKLVAASGSCSYPAQLVDLSRWKVQLPFGSPTKEVKLPTLATYKHTTYFRPNDGCKGVRFRAPTSGTTTSGANYPRTELREMKSDGTTQASWSTTSGTHTMYIDQAVLALPKGKRDIGVGQIHGGSGDVLLVRVAGNRLFVKPAGASAVTLDSNYTLGKRFRIKLVASGGAVKVYYNGSSTPALTHKRSTSTAYFKAGAYPQSNCETEAAAGQTCGESNYGEVEIYDLWVRHE